MGEGRCDPCVPESVRVEAIVAPEPRIDAHGVGGEIDQDRACPRRELAKDRVELVDSRCQPLCQRKDRSEVGEGECEQGGTALD